jgi:hypothetical protein
MNRYIEKKKLKLAFLFLLVFFLGVAFGCLLCSETDSGDLLVNVVDEDGNAVNGAKVTLGTGEKGNVGGNGQITFEDLPFTDDLSITAEKGQAQNSTVVDFNTDGQSVTIILEDEDEQDPSKVSE